MVDLEAMVNAYTDTFRRIPELVDALRFEKAPGVLDDPDPLRIRAYIDSNPAQNALDKAIYEMRSGGILVAYGQTAFESSEQTAWVHTLQVIVRAPRKAASGLELVSLLINGVPVPGDGQRWRICPVMDGLLPSEIPQVTRQPDTEGIDYFEVQVQTRETGDI